MRPWECPNVKHTKWPPWRHRLGNFKIREKRTSQILIRSFVENFIKFHTSVWATELPHTDTHTYTHTHTLGFIATYSVKMTEYIHKMMQTFIIAKLYCTGLIGASFTEKNTFYFFLSLFQDNMSKCFSTCESDTLSACKQILLFKWYLKYTHKTKWKNI